MSAGSLALDALFQGRMMPSPNYNSRKGRDVRLIVFHTAQGAKTVRELGNFFSRSSAQVSSQGGIDDFIACRYVPEDYSSWAASNANPVSTQMEICAFAEWTVAEWHRHPNMIELCARWAAAEALYHDIPLVRVYGADTATKSGVTMHIDCTKGFGGNHTDCGPAFSGVILDEIIARARQINAGNAGNPSTTNQKDDDVKFTDGIRDANPFSPEAGKDVPFGNVVQDIQANVALDARQNAGVPKFIETTNATLTRLEQNDRNQGDALDVIRAEVADLDAKMDAILAAVNK